MRFLRTAYEPDDWIAVFLKSYESGQTLQRVGPLSLFLEPKVHAWLRAMNARCFNVYVAWNWMVGPFFSPGASSFVMSSNVAAEERRDG